MKIENIEKIETEKDAISTTPDVNDNTIQTNSKTQNESDLTG